MDLVYLGQRLAELARSEIRLDAPGVPTAELVVMWDLLEHGPSGVTEVASRTRYAQSRVSTAVVGLRERKWIQVRADAADGRRTIAFVPDEVQRQAAQLTSRTPEQILGPVIAALPARQRTELIAALGELHSLLRKFDGSPADKPTLEVRELLETPTEDGPVSAHRRRLR